MPKFVSREYHVTAEKNRSEYPVQVHDTRNGAVQTVQPGDYVVTNEDGSREVVTSADFEARYEAESGNAETEVKARVQHSVTGGRSVPEGARTPWGSDEPVNGHVDTEEPHVWEEGESPAEAERTGWTSQPKSAFQGEKDVEGAPDFEAEDRPQGSEAAKQLGHEDQGDHSPDNSVGQTEEAVRRLDEVTGGREGATVVHRSPSTDEHASATWPADNSATAEDPNDREDDPEEAEAVADASPANDEPRRPADDLPTS